MKKTLKLIERFLLLSQGESVASSSLKGDWIEQMLTDHILWKVSHGRQLSYMATDTEAFKQYLATKFDIRDLVATKNLLSGEESEASRAEQVSLTGDSKFVHHRTMMGFLVNSYVDIPAMVDNKPFIIHPAEGTFTFIYDYQTFYLPTDVVIVGVENSENFRQITRQQYLFKQYSKILFVSRYPQNGDLIRWLERIPNHYIHFGDFDLAGIHIFLTEFYSHLGSSRSEFFIPEDIFIRLPFGSQSRYDAQYSKYANMSITDTRVQRLVDSINMEHKGYDQEGYIK
jgi:hypothetical protein